MSIEPLLMSGHSLCIIFPLFYSHESRGAVLVLVFGSRSTSPEVWVSTAVMRLYHQRLVYRPIGWLPAEYRAIP